LRRARACLDRGVIGTMVLIHPNSTVNPNTVLYNNATADMYKVGIYFFSKNRKLFILRRK